MFKLMRIDALFELDGKSWIRMSVGKCIKYVYCIHHVALEKLISIAEKLISVTH